LLALLSFDREADTTKRSTVSRRIRRGDPKPVIHVPQDFGQPLLVGVGWEQPVPVQAGAEPTDQVGGGLAGQHFAF